MSHQPEEIVRPGREGRCELTVEPAMTVPAFAPWFAGWRDFPDVLATIVVGGLIEEACLRAIQPALKAHEVTLGAHLSVDHLATSKIGDRLEARAVLVEVEGRTLTFKAECMCTGRLVAEGLHKRRIVDRARFGGGAKPA